MNLDDLNKLSIEELRHIKNKNLMFFNIMASIDLLVFYYSLFTERWILLFVSFGLFITGMALYDNYRISRDVLDRQGH